MKDRALNTPAIVILHLPLPGSVVVLCSGRVVAFIEEFEYAGKYLWFFVWDVDADAARRAAVPDAEVLEVWHLLEDVFVGGEEALGGADAEGYEVGTEGAKGD